MRAVPKRRRQQIFLLGLLLSSAAFGMRPLLPMAYAGRYNRQVSVGDRSPDWQDLPSCDGKTYRLSDFAAAPVVILIFTANECPVAVAYQERLKQLAAAFRPQGVVLLAINANHGEDLESMRQVASQQNYDFPYVRDESQQLARQLGATCTPHAFVLGKKREIVYMGAIDDQWLDADRVMSHYVREAVTSILAGEQPQVIAVGFRL